MNSNYSQLSQSRMYPSAWASSPQYLLPLEEIPPVHSPSPPASDYSPEVQSPCFRPQSPTGQDLRFQFEEAATWDPDTVSPPSPLVLQPRVLFSEYMDDAGFESREEPCQCPHCGPLVHSPRPVRGHQPPPHWLHRGAGNRHEQMREAHDDPRSPLSTVRELLDYRSFSHYDPIIDSDDFIYLDMKKRVQPVKPEDVDFRGYGYRYGASPTFAVENLHIGHSDSSSSDDHGWYTSGSSSSSASSYSVYSDSNDMEWNTPDAFPPEPSSAWYSDTDSESSFNCQGEDELMEVYQEWPVPPVPDVQPNPHRRSLFSNHGYTIGDFEGPVSMRKQGLLNCPLLNPPNVPGLFYERN